MLNMYQSDGGAPHPYFMGVNDRFAAISPLRGKIRDLCRGGGEGTDQGQAVLRAGRGGGDSPELYL